ncbi:unnamed protein product [Pleuronectes platessa]|uniref:Uncharacterized protein n=1 Tax=Pleuronectes platessa TaxID=8262 RepID=A0A9N7Z449_PLEPL|nr:unnamed protein product [Pleuronectes platessa]
MMSHLLLQRGDGLTDHVVTDDDLSDDYLLINSVQSLFSALKTGCNQHLQRLSPGSKSGTRHPDAVQKTVAFETQLEQKDSCLCVREKNLQHWRSSDTSKQLDASAHKEREEEEGMVEDRDRDRGPQREKKRGNRDEGPAEEEEADIGTAFKMKGHSQEENLWILLWFLS